MKALSEQFLNALVSGTAVHGYLIVSTDLDRAAFIAKQGAAILMFGSRDTSALRLHPDYFEFDGSIKIDELRMVRAELYKQAYSGKNRVVVITNVHNMNENAINAMLKMLEEPPENTFFLLSGFEQRVLPTIRSRCHIVRIEQESTESIISSLQKKGASEADAKGYALISCGNEKRAIRLYEDTDFRELRHSAISACFQIMNGETPFKWAKAIGKDREAASESIEFMLSVCHDADRFLSGLSVENNTDFEADIKKQFKHFTISRIGVIIDTLVDTSMRLTTNASVNLALDSMIVRMISLCK